MDGRRKGEGEGREGRKERVNEVEGDSNSDREGTRDAFVAKGKVGNDFTLFSVEMDRSEELVSWELRSRFLVQIEGRETTRPRRSTP